VKSTKNQFQTITTQQFLKPTRTIPTKLKTLFQHTLHSKKPYQRVTNTYTFTNKNKGKITPKRKMLELKTSSSIAAELHQHLHQNQDSPRTSTLEDQFGKPFKNSIQSFFSYRKCLISIKIVIAQHLFM